MKPAFRSVSFVLIALIGTGWLAYKNWTLRQKLSDLQAIPAVAQDVKTSDDGRQGEKRLAPAAQLGEYVVAHASTYTFLPASNVSNHAAVRALWKDPRFRATSVEKAITQIEEKYGRFFLSLRDVPTEQVEAMKLLLATQSVDMARAAVPENDSENADEMTARIGRLQAMQADQNAALQSAMGENIYDRYQEARHAESYRDSVAAIANGMRSQGVPVGDEQQEKILHAYAAAMRDVATIAQQQDSGVDLARMSVDEKSAFRERQISRMQLQLAKTCCRGGN